MHIMMQSSTVITRSKLSRYYIQQWDYSSRTWITIETHNRHPILRPNRWAMGCLLCENFRQNVPCYNGAALYLNFVAIIGWQYVAQYDYFRFNGNDWAYEYWLTRAFGENWCKENRTGCIFCCIRPDSKFHGANMEPSWGR